MVFTSASEQQAIKQKFLDFARRHNSPAMRLLATKVFKDELSVADWAQQFNLTGTWVQEWAEDTLRAWRTGTCPTPVIEGTDLKAYYPSPRSQPDTFSCVIKGTPLSRS